MVSMRGQGRPLLVAFFRRELNLVTARIRNRRYSRQIEHHHAEAEAMYWMEQQGLCG